MSACFSFRSVIGFLVGLALIGSTLTALAPVPASAQDGTPIAPTSPAGALADLLALTPDLLGGQSAPTSTIAMYGDIALQLAAVGASPITSVDDPGFSESFRATYAQVLPDPAARYTAQPEWRKTFGFDALQVDQHLMAYEPPGILTLLRGRFNEEELRTAWTASGYKRLDVAGLEVYSLFEDAEVDFDSMVGRLGLSRFNNAVILPDGTLVFAPSLDLLRQVIAVGEGQVPSLAANAEVAMLLDSVTAPLASAVLLMGSSLTGELAIDPRMTREQFDALSTAVAESGEMPPILMALFAITPGGPLLELQNPATTVEPSSADMPIATEQIVLLMTDQAAAETAAATVANRLETLSSLRTRQPYSELLTLNETTIAADAPVLILDLNFGEDASARVWLDMIFSRDLHFLAW